MNAHCPEDIATGNFLVNSAYLYHALNPKMARYYMTLGLRRLDEAGAGKSVDKKKMCSFCGNLRSPTTTTTRVKPKYKMNSRMRKILAKEDKGLGLSAYETHLAQQGKQHKLVINCKICEHRETFFQRRQIIISKSEDSQSSAEASTSRPSTTGVSKKKKKKKKKEENSTLSLLAEYKDKMKSAIPRPSPAPSAKKTKEQDSKKANFLSSLKNQLDRKKNISENDPKNLKSFLMSL